LVSYSPTVNDRLLDYISVLALDNPNITPVPKAKMALIQVSPVEFEKIREMTFARKRIPQKNCDFVTFIVFI
jgi:hypothetical protein